MDDQQTPVPRTTAPPSTRPRDAASRASSVLLAIGVLVAVGGLAFAAGRLTAPATASRALGPDGTGGAFPGGQGGGRGGGGLVGAGALTVRGTVTAVTDGTLTIRLASGTTVEVATDGSTTYHRQAAASSGDVKTGSEVLVELTPGGGGAVGGGASPRPGSSPGAGSRLGSARDVTIVAP